MDRFIHHRMDLAEYEELCHFATSAHCTPEEILTGLVEGYLARRRRYERELREDDARLEQYRATGFALSYDAIKTWLER